MVVKIPRPNEAGSIYQKHIGYFTNGYSPIYFTRQALISFKVAPQ